MKPRIDEYSAFNYLTIQGQSAPEDEQFNKALKTIYKFAYGIKAHYKNHGKDFVVPKLEGQWWIDGDPSLFDKVPRNEWYWRLLIMVPEFVAIEIFKQVRKTIFEKYPSSNANDVLFKKIQFGKCINVLHIGSYEEEKESIGKIIAALEEEQYQINGPHHEIYLSDPRRTPAWKLKTIIRYPIKEMKVIVN